MTGTRGRMDVNRFVCASGCGDDVDVRALFAYGGQSQSATAWSIDNLGPNFEPVEDRVAEGTKVTRLSTSVPLAGPGAIVFSFGVHQVTEDTNAKAGGGGTWIEVANEQGGAASMAVAWARQTATGPTMAGASWATPANGGLIAVVLS